MPFSQIPSSDLFVELSDEQQELLAGGVSNETQNSSVNPGTENSHQTQNFRYVLAGYPPSTGTPSDSGQSQYSQQSSGSPSVFSTIFGSFLSEILRQGNGLFSGNL